MKFILFYFSGTGNTRWAVNELKGCIERKGHLCEIHSIETEISNLNELITAGDVIGFAFPIYGCNIPNIMRKYIDQFKNISNSCLSTPAFLLTTSGYIDGFGPFCAKKMLKPNRFNLIGYVNLKMSNNISTPKIKANFLESEELNRRMTKGKDDIEKLVDKLISRKKHISNIGFYLVQGMIIRKVTRKPQRDNYLSLSVNEDKCIKCLLCLKSCPTKSIVLSDKGLEFLSSCTACMRCYNFCPKYAIYHEGKYADPSIYKRYRGPQSNQ